MTPPSGPPVGGTWPGGTLGGGTSGGGVPAVTPAERARFRQLQAYEDAIAYRTARLAAPCPHCGPARCDDHATDLDLILSYRHAAAAYRQYQGAHHRPTDDYRGTVRHLPVRSAPGPGGS